MPGCRVFPNEYVEQLGCDLEPGSITAMAFVEEDVDFETNPDDIENPANWINLAYAASVIIFQEVRGSYPRPAATEVPGKGKQDIRVVGRKHQATFKVNSVKGNDSFWNTMNKATNYKAAFVVGIDYDLLIYVPVNVSIDAALLVPESTDSEAEWEVVVKWSSKDVPRTHNVPAGIFE